MKAASRRRFLKLVLLGGAAVASSGATPLARSSRAATPAAARHLPSSAALPAAMRREIASQKAYVARTLQTVRDYALPAGSEMAFVFRPVARPSRKPRR